MSTPNDVIRGVLKLDGLVEGKCFTSWADFLKNIPGMFSVEVPAEITNVTISNQAPPSDRRDNLWVQLDNSGSFVGLFLYMQGLWQQIYPVPQAIFKMYGNSNNIPAGFQLADETNPNLTASQAAFLKAKWKRDGTDTYWEIFEVTYRGF